MPGHRKRRQFRKKDAFTKGMVIGLKRAGWSIRQIAADTHLGASTVHRLWRRWLEQGNVAINRNVGATRVTSARVDRRILRQAVAAPQATCTAILQHVQDTLDHSISTRTISRRLVANGLHSCRPLRRLPLTPPNRRHRLEWCRARSTWMTEWHRVVFSDESRFCLSSDSRRVRVWRRRGERSNPAAIVERPTVRQRHYDSQRNVDDVLRPVTLPYLQGVPNALYQQDNARPHTARISQQALQDVQMLPWPPYSPDLSPIEHVWDIIGRRLHALPQPRSVDELWQMVEKEWRAIPQDAIRTLIDSLPRRVAACIAVRDNPRWVIWLEGLLLVVQTRIDNGEVEKKSQSLQAEMEEHFAHTTTRDIEGRYEVAVPLVQEEEIIPANRGLDENKLISDIIECAREDKLDGVHYLIHRPVYKRNSQTSRLRPVFNAPARKRGSNTSSSTEETHHPKIGILACLIVARLAANVIQDLEFEEIPRFYWTDSINALCWIQKEDNWAHFVMNRVKKIHNLSSPESWRHIPGQLNPADLPARGCSAETLKKTKWWEGPAWLKVSQEEWPKSTIIPDLEIIYSERRKIILNTLCTRENENLFERISRIKTKICRREDFANFRMPILLPLDHFLVSLVIRWNHETHGHAGPQTLLGILRENYWIRRSRKTVNIINQCIRCKRFIATPATVESIPLPEDRVRDAAVFEIEGVDLTGHLILKNK
ncbi:hypothetical protein LAZ67_21001362 [Cordylochernes scorpioides]|uniref:Transposase n=1 Tax=Cordylochernes scorpioides TaxID=51811 RepID=A0ABY6LM37_9ARAC|nr:hypothetical protein LAZ67_21001362 [Cordylochernes scorpioides]